MNAPHFHALVNHLSRLPRGKIMPENFISSNWVLMWQISAESLQMQRKGTSNRANRGLYSLTLTMPSAFDWVAVSTGRWRHQHKPRLSRLSGTGVLVFCRNVATPQNLTRQNGQLKKKTSMKIGYHNAKAPICPTDIWRAPGFVTN